jgi:hypothetical protein
VARSNLTAQLNIEFCMALIEVCRSHKHAVDSDAESTVD